jgi:hypothetical protein
LSTKNQKVAEKTLENYENQENILKLQGKTDKEILKGKIVLQENVVKANKANLLGLEATTKAEIAASRMREHALLFQFKLYKYLIGIALDFATKPIDLFIDKVNSIADSVGIGKLITFNTADIKKSAIGAVEAVEGTFKSVFTSIGLIADQNALTKSIDEAKSKLLISENELAGSKLALREMDIQSGKELVKSEQNNAKEQINIDRQLMDEKLRIMEDGFDKEYAILKEKRKRDKEDALKQLKEGVLSQKDYDRLIMQIDESFEADRKKLYETSADERMKTLQPDTSMFKKGQKEEIDLLMQGEAEKAAKRKEAKEKEIEDNKKLEEEKWQTTQDFAQKATDYLKKQSDERISLIDKEISAAEKQADIYRELAANGNINAKESLAEQERIIAEGNRRKEREQKRQQRMELANTIYQTYASHAAKDPKTALMNTIKDASLLQAFISSLPMFYDGTEDTGAGGGVDGKGGFHAVLHPHERVIPKSLNDQIGNLTNEQLTRLAMEYQNGRLVGQDVAHSSMDLAILVNEMKDLKEIIKHKPETNIQLGEITQSAMEIVQSTRKGNTTVYNRFKVRK